MPQDDNIDDVIRGVVDALMEMPVFRWAEAKMQEESEAGTSSGMADGAAPTQAEPAAAELPAETPAAPAPSDPPPAPAPPTDPPPSPSAEQPPTGQAPAEQADPPVDPAERERLARYEALDQLGDEELAQYMARRQAKKKKYEAGQEPPPTERTATTVDDEAAEYVETEHYSRGGADVLKYARQIEGLKNALARTEAKVVDQDRRAALVDLHINGVMLDVDKEMERLCYQRMPQDADFDAACQSIRQNYQRLPVQGLPPALGDDPPLERLKYQRDNAEAIVAETIRRCDRIRRGGQEPSFDDVYAAVVAEGPRSR